MDRQIRKHQILKWIPRLLLLAAIGFGAYVYLNYGKVQDADSPSDTPKKQKRIVQEVHQVDYAHFDEGKLVYRVKADRNRVLKNDTQQLEKPQFIFYDDQQEETIRVTGQRCTISRDFNTITVINDTVVKAQNGTSVFAHQLKYDSRLQQFSTPSPSRFEYETMNGKSKGFVYVVENELLILPENPEVRYIKKGEEHRPPITIVGESGAIDRKNGFAYFEGDVEVQQGKNRITAERMEVNFKPGGNDIEKITALRNVQAHFVRSDQSEEELPEEPQETTSAAADAAGLSNLFSNESSTGKDLEADHVELFLAEDGSTPKAFRSTGNSVFVIHVFDEQNKPAEKRTIQGDLLNATFNAAGEMEQFHAVHNVSVHVQPLREARRQKSPQTIYCDDLLAFFTPTTGDIKEIHFNNGFRHEQNNRVVSSDQAVYFGAEQKTDLIGNPEIQDASFTITSDAMSLLEQSSGIHAEGNVKSTFLRKEGKTPSTFPFSSPSDQPVYISAEKMDWDSQREEATYTGKAKLWQEKNVITAARLVINDRDKSMSAYEKVHTIFYKGTSEEAKKSKKKKKGDDQEKATVAVQEESEIETMPEETEGKIEEKPESEAPEEENKLISGEGAFQDGPISVDSEIMNYVEKDRIVHFEKSVKIITPSTRINSETADFHLKQETSDIDRLFAQGKVSLRHQDKTGTGQRATFYSGDERLVLEGSPRLSESGKADIIGGKLTLFLTDGRILIDGQEDGRASTTLEMESGSFSFQKPDDKKTSDAGLKNREPN